MRDFTIDLLWTKVQIAFTALGGWLGGADGLMTALIVLMALDYVTGVLCAALSRQLSSAVGFRGLCRKALILALVAMAHVIDVHVVGAGHALRGAVICFYLSNEGLSLLENAARIGLPIPERLRGVLAQLHDHPGDGDVPPSPTP